jgi:hypothetical protein
MFQLFRFWNFALREIIKHDCKIPVFAHDEIWDAAFFK